MSSSDQQQPPSAPKALSSISFSDAIKLRRSIYALNNTSPISNEKIVQIVKDAMHHVPSSFNSQSARLLVLLGADHTKFWEMAMSCHHEAAGSDTAKWERTNPRMEGLKKAYGTIVFYEDSATVRQFQDKFPAYHDIFPEWSVQSGGMHQFVLWTALEAEGLGANLQHYQVVESVSKKASEIWGVDKDWDMAAQLVFGGVEDGGRPTEAKEKKSTDETVKVFGA